MQAMKRRIESNEPWRWRLREARLARGLRLKDAAEATHYSYGAIARAERGILYAGNKKDIRRAEFWRIMSDFYGIPADELQRVEVKE